MAKKNRGIGSNMGSSVSSGTATATAPRPTSTKTPQVKPSVNPTASGNGGMPTYEQIAQRAREIWAKNGYPHGQDEKNWLEAERQLKAERADR